MCERTISEEKMDARAQARAHFKGEMCTPRGGGSILSYFVEQ